jgi:G3E family GTPase
VLSGFLGSGKTTLLRRAMVAPDAHGVALIVNELGEIGLDQHQFAHIAERTVLLDNGCLCCATREDLRDSLRELIDAEEHGRTPAVRKVVLETSGLADPVPILATLDRDPLLRHRFAVDRIVVTCDAQHAPSHVGLAEWHAQVAAADVLVITKTDLVEPPQASRVLRLACDRNPAAAVADAPAFDLLRLDALPREPRYRGDLTPHHHSDGVSTASAVVDGTIDPARAVVWLSALLHAHGSSILRLKALVDTGEGEGPVVLDAVQHVVYPPRHLPAWDGPRRSTIVAISGSGLDARRIVDAFSALASLS